MCPHAAVLPPSPGSSRRVTRCRLLFIDSCAGRHASLPAGVSTAAWGRGSTSRSLSTSVAAAAAVPKCWARAGRRARGGQGGVSHPGLPTWPTRHTLASTAASVNPNLLPWVQCTHILVDMSFSSHWEKPIKCYNSRTTRADAYPGSSDANRCERRGLPPPPPCPGLTNGRGGGPATLGR